MRDLKILKSITNRNEESLSRYLNDIGQIKMIDSKEEVRLAKMIREGDSKAEHRLITANLRFVVSCAKKYQNKGMSLQDLVNEGNIGLIRAAKSFDETRGFKFISYAVWWIRQAILQALNENVRMIRLPMNQQIGMREVGQQRQKMEQLLEREPTLEELAEAMSKREDQVLDYVLSNLSTSSYDDAIPGEDTETGTFLDLMPNEEENLVNIDVLKDYRQHQIKIMFSVLSKREKEVLSMAFGLFGSPIMNNEDIARRMGLTKERIRQLIKYALGKIRKMQKPAYLQNYA